MNTEWQRTANTCKRCGRVREHHNDFMVTCGCGSSYRKLTDWIADTFDCQSGFSILMPDGKSWRVPKVVQQTICDLYLASGFDLEEVRYYDIKNRKPLDRLEKDGMALRHSTKSWLYVPSAYLLEEYSQCCLCKSYFSKDSINVCDHCRKGNEFVYVIRSNVTSLTKIGKTCSPRTRIRDIRNAGGHVEIQLVDLFLSKDALGDELAAHEIAAKCRVVGEWFCDTPDLRNAIAWLQSKLRRVSVDLNEIEGLSGGED